jgi:hypothetical protein
MLKNALRCRLRNLPGIIRHKQSCSSFDFFVRRCVIIVSSNQFVGEKCLSPSHGRCHIVILFIYAIEICQNPFKGEGTRVKEENEDYLLDGVSGNDRLVCNTYPNAPIHSDPQILFRENEGESEEKSCLPTKFSHQSSIERKKLQRTLRQNHFHRVSCRSTLTMFSHLHPSLLLSSNPKQIQARERRERCLFKTLATDLNVCL